MKRIFFYASLGGILEFYDFIIFAIFAKAIASNFFPTTSLAAGFLFTFTIFAAGYLIRPIGGLVYGHFGDKYGRKKTFTYSIILMALSTLLIGLIPTYNSIGIIAPILLTILRLLQGASIGGEIPGAITLIAESSIKNKTFGCSILFFSLVSGIILGELVHIIFQFIMSSSELMNYGWRYAFIIGGFFGLWGFILRKKLSETPLFSLLDKNKARKPVIKLIKEYPRQVIIGWSLMGTISAGIMCLFLIIPSYLRFTKLTLSHVSLINTLILFIVMISSIIFGFVGDKTSKKFILAISLIISMASSYIIFGRLFDKNLSLISYTIYCTLTFGVIVAIIPSMLAELFPTEIRYSGVALVYNLSFATTGGLAPMIIFYFISNFNIIMMPPVYFIIASLIAFIALISSKSMKNYLI